MANKILPFFETQGTFTITADALASSTAGVGRQSTLLNNTSTRYKRLRISAKVVLNAGSAATAGTSLVVYAIRGDNNGTPYNDDNAGASDAALTVINADPVAVIGVKASPSAGDVLYKDFILEDPGLVCGIAVVHNTGFALGTGNTFRYIGEEPEIQ